MPALSIAYYWQRMRERAEAILPEHAGSSALPQLFHGMSRLLDELAASGASAPQPEAERIRLRDLFAASVPDWLPQADASLLAWVRGAVSTEKVRVPSSTIGRL